MEGTEGMNYLLDHDGALALLADNDTAGLDHAAPHDGSASPLADAHVHDPDHLLDTKSSSLPDITVKTKTKTKDSLAANQRARKKKKALRNKAKAFQAEDALIDFDDMDGQNATTKKDKLEVMNKVIENRHVHEGWMMGAIEMVSCSSDTLALHC